MLRILKKRNNKEKLSVEKEGNNQWNSKENTSSDDMALILELMSQIQKQTDLVIKEEGASTVNFNSLIENEDYTKEQIQNVKNHLESVENSSNLTKELLVKIIKGLSDSSSDLSNAKTKNEIMVSEMNNVIDVFAQFNVLFEELQKEYNQIEKLASVISGIANKTKMLSLNASIEAARAGEHGKGFVVVAEEINKLSESTQSNAKSIMASLEAMTDIIIRLNNKTKEGTNMLPSTQEMINNSTSAFHSISSIEDKLLQSLQGVINSQDENVTRISEVNSDLLNIINKADADNSQYKNLVLGVQKKADYYLHLLHYLNQIEVLKEQMSQ